MSDYGTFVAPPMCAQLVAGLSRAFALTFQAPNPARGLEAGARAPARPRHTHESFNIALPVTRELDVVFRPYLCGALSNCITGLAPDSTGFSFTESV